MFRTATPSSPRCTSTCDPCCYAAASTDLSRPSSPSSSPFLRLWPCGEKALWAREAWIPGTGAGAASWAKSSSASPTWSRPRFRCASTSFCRRRPFGTPSRRRTAPTAVCCGSVARSNDSTFLLAFRSVNCFCTLISEHASTWYENYEGQASIQNRPVTIQPTFHLNRTHAPTHAQARRAASKLWFAE